MRVLSRRLQNFLVAGFSAALLGCTGFLNPGERSADLRELVAAKAKWNSNGFANYDLVVRASCFCPYGGESARLEVRGGQVLKRSLVVSGMVLDPSLGRMFRSVEELFDLIEDALQRHAAKVRVTYQPTIGYPVQVEIDYAANAADDELSHTVETLLLPPR